MLKSVVAAVAFLVLWMGVVESLVIQRSWVSLALGIALSLCLFLGGWLLSERRRSP